MPAKTLAAPIAAPSAYSLRSSCPKRSRSHASHASTFCPAWVQNATRRPREAFPEKIEIPPEKSVAGLDLGSSIEEEV
jgi:hypothetical protein